MPSSVRFDVTAETKDFESAFQRAQREVLKLEEANRRLAAQSKTFAKDARDQNNALSEGLTAMASRAAAAVATYATLSAAIRVVNADLEIQKRLQRETAQTQLGTAASEREAIINMGYISPAQRQQALSQVNSIAARHGISRVEAQRGFSAGIGLSGNPASTIAALDVAARLNPYDVGQLTPGLLQAVNATRSTNATANLGFMLGMQQVSPVKSTSLVGQNVMPAVAGIRLAGGDTDIQAAGIATGLAVALGDVEGNESGTAAQRFAAVLATQLPKLGSTTERLEYLQQHPAEAQRAAGKFEQGKTKAALVSMFDANSLANRKRLETMAAIPKSEAERVAAAEGMIQAAGATSVQRLGSLDRSLAAGTESIQFGPQADPAAAAGAIRERLNDLENKLGVPTIGRWQRWMMDVGASLAGRDPLESLMVQAEFLRRASGELGRSDAEPALREMVIEIRNLRGELGRSTRQNATNDLNTHTEGR